ncbi:pyridoxal phosphate-dependent aminotransferase [Bradyrhizobium sacchari]|uniref:aspartate transaminase n=1 Tax=Bradyrhizobium sacchari TaxID=1399419 RepID=A0A560KFZ6_9BRAD|nr:pyridoxal phosphate-dependent aminotransferase [Bradyrhizobium sacchari]TWB64541.1 aspartate aminotransferase [Bradyrhizobium sacchari]TWB80864.1 aspartate aminotransferase [Bradyrhizobium sacchari]
MLAQQISSVPGSGTAAAREAAEIAAEAGGQLIDLTGGQVIIEPPSSLAEGAIAAINAGTNQYTDSIGLKSSCKAFADKLSAQTGLGWNTEEIPITAGAKQGLLDAIPGVLEPADEVIIIRPCWPTFQSQVILAGAKPVFVEARSPTYVPEIIAIRTAVTPRTKAIIINSLNNATCAVSDQTPPQTIGDLAINYLLWIVSDECYSSLAFTGARQESIVMAHLGPRSGTILINAFHKELAITGWRQGYFVAAPEVVAAAKKLHSYTTSTPNVAILDHLQFGDGSFERTMHQRLSLARKTDLRILPGLVDVPTPSAEGSFFFYLNLSRFFADVTVNPSVRSATIAYDWS